MAAINTVPTEVLFLTFKLLPPKSLRAVVLVCRRWREVGEHPSLWTFVTFMVNHRNLTRVPLMLGSRRFQAVRKLYLGELDEEVLEAVVRHPGLKELNMSFLQMSGSYQEGRVQIPAIKLELLSKASASMEVVNLSNMMVTSNENEAVFSKIFKPICEESKLKKLDVSNNDLSSVEPGLMAKLVQNLEYIDLITTGLTNQQTDSIFRAINETSKLKFLSIRNNNLSSVKPEILAAAMAKLEEVDINGSDLTREQEQAIFAKLCNNCCKLRNLSFGFSNSLCSVHPDTIARAANRLESFQLFGSATTQQTEEILRQSLVKTKLQRLHIEFLVGKEVDQELLEQARKNIAVVDFEEQPYG